MRLKFAFILAGLFILSACSPFGMDEIGAKFTITNERFKDPTYLYIYEYSEDGDRINNTEIKCKKGETYAFTALPQTTKLKLKLWCIPLFDEYQYWIQRVYPLDKKKTTRIILDKNVEWYTEEDNIEP